MATKIPKYVYEGLVNDAARAQHSAHNDVYEKHRDALQDAEAKVLSELDLNELLISSIKVTPRQDNWHPRTGQVKDECNLGYHTIKVSAGIKGKSKIRDAVKKACKAEEKIRDAKLAEIDALYTSWKLKLYNKLIEGGVIEMPDFSAIVNAK